MFVTVHLFNKHVIKEHEGNGNGIIFDWKIRRLYNRYEIVVTYTVEFERIKDAWQSCAGRRWQVRRRQQNLWLKLR